MTVFALPPPDLWRKNDSPRSYDRDSQSASFTKSRAHKQPDTPRSEGEKVTSEWGNFSLPPIFPQRWVPRRRGKAILSPCRILCKIKKVRPAPREVRKCQTSMRQNTAQDTSSFVHSPTSGRRSPSGGGIFFSGFFVVRYPRSRPGDMRRAEERPTLRGPERVRARGN